MREGRRVRAVLLDVRGVASLLPYPRVGIIVPKHKHSSVDRNRLKRRLRELVRLELLPALAAGGHQVDVVLRARRESYAASLEQLGADVRRVVEQAGRIAATPPLPAAAAARPRTAPPAPPPPS